MKTYIKQISALLFISLIISCSKEEVCYEADLVLVNSKFYDEIENNTLDRVGIVSFNLRNLHAHDVAQVLDDYGIAVRAGHHCTNILHQTLGVVASVRISFGIYNHKLEIDRLLDALKKTKEVFFTN